VSNPAALHVDRPYRLKEWFDLDDAREAAKAAALRRRGLDDQYEEQVRTAAEAEATYRRAVAKKVTQHRADGKGAGESELLAKGDLWELSLDRDIQAGMLRAVQHRIDAAEGERANLRQLMDWSSRLRVDGREA